MNTGEKVISCTVAEAEKHLGYNLLELLSDRGLNFALDDKIEIIFREDYIVITDDEDGETIINNF